MTADLGQACEGGGAQLRELAELGIKLLWQVSDDLTQTYFTHARPAHAMGKAERSLTQVEAPQ